MRHDPLGAVVGEGQQAAAIGHQLLRPLADGGEGEAGDIHGHGEVLARRLDVLALQLVLVGEGDGVDDEIEARPKRSAEGGEDGVDAGFVGDVAGQDVGRRRPDSASGFTRFSSASP